MHARTTQSLVGSALLLAAVGSPAAAISFTGAPLFSEVNEYSTLIEEDPADIYYPVLSEGFDTTPIVLMLQGALVDKADYRNYARIVSSYGFTVVVPNNTRTLVAPNGTAVTGLFPEQDWVQQVLDFAALENENAASPVAGLLDVDSLGLLGHSFGGATGIAATQDNCFFVLCARSYELPEALKAGVFYGANFDVTGTGLIPPIDNQVPTGLIFGTRDGVAIPAETVTTFDQLLNPPKVLVEVSGANHYGITDTDSFRDPIRPTLDQAIATETIGRWSGAFLRAHVLDDAEAWEYVYTGLGDALDENVAVTSKPVPESASVLGLMAIAFLGAVSLRKRQRYQ